MATVQEVAKQYGVSEAEVVDAGAKYFKGRQRAKKQGETKRAELREFRTWKAAGKK